MEAGSPVRILQYDLNTGESVGEFVYLTDEISSPPDPADGFAVNGLVELLSVDNDSKFLALERSFSAGVGNNLRLYEVDISDATDVSNLDSIEGIEVEAVNKELLLDFDELGIDLDNSEALAFGPTLSDGRQSLIVASDNNFSDTQETQFLAFAIDFDSDSTDGGDTDGGDTDVDDTDDIFTLQLLHAADQEGGIPALEDAPNFSAVLDALENEDADGDGNSDYANTLTLSSGDAYIPGPFFSAGEAAFGGQGRGDILIQNELGFDAIALGNHEFDFGTGTVADLISPDEETGYPGTAFPYLSSNLDFSTDEDLAPLVREDGQEASDIPNSIAGNNIVTVNGEQIGVVGATTPTLPSISSPGDVTVNPIEFSSDNPQDIAALAAEIQASVDELLAENPDINKVILLAHMQQISIEEQLSELLTDVDIIVAGGSNTLLADDTDRLRAGDEVEGVYPPSSRPPPMVILLR